MVRQGALNQILFNSTLSSLCLWAFDPGNLVSYLGNVSSTVDHPMNPFPSPLPSWLAQASLGLLLPAALASFAAPTQAEPHEMFPTQAAAEQRAKQLKCTGTFAMGKEWMPCKDFATYKKAAGKQH